MYSSKKYFGAPPLSLKASSKIFMKKNDLYKSEAAAAIHETATGLYDAGVFDKDTMREFDKPCYTRETRRALTDVRATDTETRRRILSGDGRGLQNRLRGSESCPGWVRLPHASANLN